MTRNVTLMLLALSGWRALAPRGLAVAQQHNVSVTELVAFFAAPGPSLLEEPSAKGRILAAEIGAAANQALTQLLSQPVRKESWRLLVGALGAASYSPIVVPESLLMWYATLPDRNTGLDAVIAGDLRFRALIALSYRPRPHLSDFWQRLWEAETDPSIRQLVLAALACSNPEAVIEKVNVSYSSRLLNEVAARVSQELRRGDDAHVCHGGESTREGAAVYRPGIPPWSREAGRAMLTQAGVLR